MRARAPSSRRDARRRRHPIHAGASPRMKSRSIVLSFAAASSTLAGLYACSSDDVSPTTPSSLDAGHTNETGAPAGDGATADVSTSDAGPSTPCSALPGKVVYIESGDTQENLLKRIGRSLRDSANVTLAFNLTGSCTLTNDLYTGAKMVPNGTLKYIPSTVEDPT